MSIDVKDIYDQAFKAHRHASDYRAKIIGGWGAMYTGFAGVFAWVQVNHHESIWIVATAASLMTLAMWAADHRNRPAIRRAKNIGQSIEEDGIPKDLRFFSTLHGGLTHTRVIDIFGFLSFLLFVAAAVWPLCQIYAFNG